MSAAEFYTDARLGNTFGVKGPYYGARGHLGVDWTWDEAWDEQMRRIREHDSAFRVVAS